MNEAASGGGGTLTLTLSQWGPPKNPPSGRRKGEGAKMWAF